MTSEPASKGNGGGSPTPFKAVLAAVQFLTITPPIIRRGFTSRELGSAVGYYPLVGAMIGLVLLGSDYLLAYVAPTQLRSALILALWVLLTGALHLDGFLDTCDGLLGGHTPEKRLEIMRDERIGAYGFAGGILLILTKFTALTTLDNRLPALFLAPIIGRWGMAAALFAFPYVREEGLGRQIKDNVSNEQVILATIIALAAITLTAGWVGLLVFFIAALTVWFGAVFALKRIPGLTGDIYGALNELVETVALISLVIAQTL